MLPVDAIGVFFRGFVEFSRVKYLELRLKLVEVQDEHSVLFLTAMIELGICPCLQIFRLAVTNHAMQYSENGWYV